MNVHVAMMRLQLVPLAIRPSKIKKQMVFWFSIISNTKHSTSKF
jgi:hypothetical protein